MQTIAVVGAGIAGLATAELLQRFPGNRVVLIEGTQQFGAGASMDQHGWFHAGSLYSLKGNASSVESAVANLRVVTDLYRPFLHLPETAGGQGRWFSERPIHYVFPGAAADLEPFAGLTSCEELRNFLRLAPTITAAEADLGRLRGFDRELRGLRLVGADAPMHTHLMLGDLAGSFLAHGGEVLFSCRYIGHRREGPRLDLQLADGSTLAADKLIVTSGAQIAGSQLRMSGLTVRKSPIMVLIPPLCPDNFVVVEDSRHPSMSHILHSYDNRPYSVVSGGYTADADDDAGQAAAATALRKTVESYFPTRFGESRGQVFFGTKVDMAVNEQIRDYSPNILEIERDVLVAVPGKFSFAFLLARDITTRVMTGTSAIPGPKCAPTPIDPMLIARPRHEAVARALFGAGPRQRASDSPSQEFQHVQPS